MDANAWDERYRSAGLLWSAGPNKFVAERLEDEPPGVGIDLASGEGRNAIWLASKGWKMTAVDFSSVALDRGREMSDGNVEFVEANVLDWEPTEKVDLVLIAYLHIEAEFLSDIVRRAAGWLSPGGQLFMVGHDVTNIDEGIGGPQVPEILWDLDLLVEWVGPLLDIVEGGIVKRPVEVDGEVYYARDTLVRGRAGG